MDLLASTPIISVTQNRERFVLQFPHYPTWIEEMKQRLPGIRRDRDSGTWTVPVNSTNADCLRKAQPFTWTDEAKAAAANIYILEAMRTACSKATTGELIIPTMGKQPYPFQRAGIQYALDRKKVIIGDEMGLGKTIQGIGTMEAGNLYPTLIVVPPGFDVNWAEEELAACVPHRQILLANKKTAPLLLRMADVVVTTYTQLVGYRNYTNNEGKKTRSSFTDTTKKDVILSPLAEELIKIKFRLGIWDEAHRLKDGATAQTMASMEVRKGMEYILLLTGTPMMNSVSEFASLLRFIDRLDHFGGWYHFMTHHCGMIQTKFGMQAKAANDTQALHDNLRATCYVRRLKKDVLLELPENTRGHVLVEIDNREEYKQAEEELIEWVKAKVKRDEEFLASIAHLDQTEQRYQIALRQEEKAAAAERAEVMVRIQALKDVAARGKLKAAKEWIDTFLESGEKLVVFAMHKTAIKQLLKWYPDAARIVAEDDGRTRAQNVKRFQTDKDCRLIIGAMGTSAASSPAGVGWTLTASSNTLTLELGWNPAIHDQMEARCHRNGQRNAVNNNYMLGRNTIDLDNAQLIEGKRAVCREVVDGIFGETEESSILDDFVSRLAAR